MSDDDKNDTTPPSSSNGAIDATHEHADEVLAAAAEVAAEPTDPDRCARCAVAVGDKSVRRHPNVPELCIHCGHAYVIERSLATFADMANAIKEGIAQLAGRPDILAGVAASGAPAGAAGADVAQVLDEHEAKRLELADPTNVFAVSANGDDVVILAAADRTKLPPQSVLNLCAWLSVVADLTDGDLIAARRKVEAT